MDNKMGHLLIHQPNRCQLPARSRASFSVDLTRGQQKRHKPRRWIGRTRRARSQGRQQAGVPERLSRPPKDRPREQGAAVPAPAAPELPANSRLLAALAWIQETDLLFKSAFTKKPLRSVKINYFEVFSTGTPPALPPAPVCCSTGSSCDYI